MRIFTPLFAARLVPVVLLLLSVNFTVAAATITETFNRLNASTTSTTQSGSFTGVGGVSWDYAFVRKVSGRINGASAELDRNGRGRLTTTLSDGLSTLRFKLRTIDGRWHTTAKVRVLINGQSYGVHSPRESDVVRTVTISGIDLNGNVTVELTSIGSLEAIVDDVALESGGTAPPAVGGNDLAINGQGWSVISRSSDTRVIYCSSSRGNDANDGRSQSRPVKTLNKAFSLIRNGYPDHVYLRRGDTWVNQTFAGLKNRSGRSGSERLVVSYYGSGSRPRVKTNNVRILNNSNLDHVAIIGIEFYNYTTNPRDRDWDDPGNNGVKIGFRFVGVRVKNLLFEDCKFSYYANALDFYYEKDSPIGDAFRNLDIRRNIIVNQYQRGATDAKVKSQGIFISHAADFLLEENFFDHNGWNEQLADAQPNQYNHNVYLSTDNTGPMVVRGNVLSRGAAHGLQLRSGGTAKYNAMIGNAIGMNVGYSSFPTFYQGSTLVEHNVVTDGRPQIPNDTQNPQTGAVWGIWKQSISKLTVRNNIVANIADTRGGNMRPYNGMTANEYGNNNIAWNWTRNNVPASNPGWRDPSRDKTSYVNSVGYGNYDAWVNAASKRPLRSFPTKFTARRYVDYIKEGFTVTASSAARTTETEDDRQPTAEYFDRAYPNPARSGTVTVESTEPPQSIRLRAVDGRLLREIRQTSYLTILDVSGLPPGVYLMEIAHQASRTAHKLVLSN